MSAPMVRTSQTFQYVLCGGSPTRMESFARYIRQQLSDIIEAPEPENLSRTSRYVLYKVGPVVLVNHGIGTASISVVLNEILKILHYAGARGVTFIRCGTSGGIGVPHGELVVSTEGLNGELKPEYIQYVFGKRRAAPSIYDQGLVKELLEVAQSKAMACSKGKTLTADGFYEDQGRLHGMFCDYTSEEADNFIHQLYNEGVRNIDMESTCLAALCSKANVRAGCICVSLWNRLSQDTINWSSKEMQDLEALPGKLACEYIRKQILESKIV